MQQQVTQAQVLEALRTGMAMIENKSAPRAIRAFMSMACEFLGRDVILGAMGYLDHYRPLLKYL